MGDCETDSDDRPLNPPRLESAQVLSCPFDDIEPRMSKKEQEQKEEEERKKNSRQHLKRKNLSLLSFGEEAAEEEATQVVTKIKSSHDVLDDPRLSKDTVQLSEKNTYQNKRVKQSESLGDETPSSVEEESDQENSKNRDSEDQDFEKKMRMRIVERRKHGFQKPKRQKQSEKIEIEKSEKSDSSASEEETVPQENEYNRLRQDIRNLNKSIRASKTGMQEDKQDVDVLLTPLEQRRQKYVNRRRKTAAREHDTLSKLDAFKSKLYTAGEEDAKDNEASDDDADWYKNELRFVKHWEDSVRQGKDDGLIVIQSSSQNKKGKKSRPKNQNIST